MNNPPVDYQHWQIQRDANQIIWLFLDKQGSSVNTIDQSVLEELTAILKALEADSTVKGLVIGSAKATGFIAGADISQFDKATTAEQALPFIQQGQRVYNQLAALKIPTVAMIEGFCLGGGLELALACRYRIVEESEKTKLGLPEVKLGIYPCWGGSLRLPRLLGGPTALSFILQGKVVNAKTAVKLGIADEIVPKRQLQRAAQAYIERKPTPKKATWWQIITNKAAVRPLLAKFIRRQLAQKVNRAHYPAPYAVLENWEVAGVEGGTAVEREAKVAAQLLVGETAQNLVRAFFLQEKLKGLAKGIDFQVNHVHVIGAGTMGGDIAAWCAFNGITVTLQDRAPEYIAPALQRAYELAKKKLKQPRSIQAMLDKLQPDVHGYGIAKADLILEAIYEDATAKQTLFQQIEEKAKPEAILATNTSSIPLDEINKVLNKPERLVGIHFFNPVAQMQLVEVVIGEKTSEEAKQHALAFVKQIKRLPLPVKSKPGFLVNRILLPYLMESMILLQENVAPESIDKAATDFGMPMGPIELADTVGLDVCLSVAKNLAAHYGGTIPSELEEMVRRKHLGRKTGQGFYIYKKGKPQKNKAALANPVSADVTDRLILRMLNEAIECLYEQIVEDQDLLDAGMIFGTGFAPFRGGPMHYLRSQGPSNIKQRLERLQQQYGERFKPSAGWAEYTHEQLK